MSTQRARLALVVALAALALPACKTDDAIERDTRETRQKLDKGAGSADEKLKDTADDAGDKIERGVEDVDGR